VASLGMRWARVKLELWWRCGGSKKAQSLTAFVSFPIQLGGLEETVCSVYVYRERVQRRDNRELKWGQAPKLHVKEVARRVGYN